MTPLIKLAGQAFLAGAVAGLVLAAGVVAGLLAMGATLMPDDVELPDTDPIDADRADLPYGGGWGA